MAKCKLIYVCKGAFFALRFQILVKKEQSKKGTKQNTLSYSTLYNKGYI